MPSYKEWLSYLTLDSRVEHAGVKAYGFGVYRLSSGFKLIGFGPEGFGVSS